MTDPVAAPTTVRVRPPVAALLLGYAGLLPPIIGIAWRLIDPAKGGAANALALFYAALILSFLGGMWWGAATARVSGAALTLWLAVAVMPSLVALAAGAVLFPRSCRARRSSLPGCSGRCWSIWRWCGRGMSRHGGCGCACRCRSAWRR